MNRRAYAVFAALMVTAGAVYLRSLSTGANMTQAAKAYRATLTEEQKAIVADRAPHDIRAAGEASWREHFQVSKTRRASRHSECVGRTLPAGSRLNSFETAISCGACPLFQRPALGRG